MIGWLKEQKVAPRVDTPPRDEKPAAWVEPSFGSGSVVLLGGDRLVRVVWPLGAKDPRREIPPGEYTIRELRIERKREAEYWFVASSGAPFEPLLVSPKGRTVLTIDDGLACTARAQPKGDRLNIGFSMRAKNGRGVSVFKDSKRIPVSYRVLDKDGKELADGMMNYG